MNKTKFIKIIIFIILFSAIRLIAGNYAVYIDDQQVGTLTTRDFGGKEYIDPENAANFIFPNNKFYVNKGEIISGFKRIKCTPDSYYLLYEKYENVRISKMNSPAILVGNKVYLPYPDYLISLAEVSDNDISFSRQSIFIKSSKYKSKYKAIFPNLSKESLRKIENDLDQKKKNDANESNENDDITNLDSNSKPIINKYIKQKDSQDYEYHYRIPKKLKREELKNYRRKYDVEDTSKTSGSIFHLPDFSVDEKVNSSHSQNLLAGANFSPAANMTKIIEIYAQAKDSLTEIHLKADDIIVEYHKPEIKEGQLILRLPDVINGITDYSKIERVFPFDSVHLEIIRNFILYKIDLRGNVTRLNCERNGPAELIYYVYHDGTKLKTPPPAEEKKSIDHDTADSPVDLSDIKIDKDKWKLDVIVLDPGHGGKDPGAVSIRGYHEKDLALSIAQKVKTLINRFMPRTKVVMTRNDDTFIELYRRGKIANENNGKLFISIHLNSMPNKPWPSNGFETYILRPGRNEDAVRVAEKENSVIRLEEDKSKYKKLTEEELILAAMAQSAFVKLSEKFARILQEEVDKTTPLKNRGVNQAGFYVLVGASMPNVLFEAGFLSNKNDERYLISDAGQNNIAKGMFNAIERYIEEYEKLVNGSK